jgi:branched-chain amino acid transport system substrate-binding protein
MKSAFRRVGAILAVGLACFTSPALAQSGEVKIGMITTLSGPGSGLGIDVRDAFALALKDLGGSLGGLKATVIEADDQQKPDVAKQLADRMVERDKVDVVTGIIWSNLALALMPSLERAEVFFLSSNAGPSQLAGKQCNPFFFGVAYQNDGQHEAMGQHMQSQGIKRAYLMAPNYPAGKDALTGVKRFYKGEIAGEVYTTVGQLDYAAELAQLRAAAPDGVYIFYPGGMGINFVKQYEQAGLKGKVPLFGPGFSFSEDSLPAIGDAALGVMNTAQWSGDIDNPQNKKFVQGFETAYNRLPSVYAAQAYDVALLLDSAIRKTGGNLADKNALRAALQAADFKSIRGDFKFNSNHYPIQDYYLREVVKDDKGRLTNVIRGTVFNDHVDPYAAECKM